MTRKDRTEGIYNRREVLDESERRQYCLIQLKDLLSYAYRYSEDVKKRFDRAQFNVEKFKTLSDIKHIPLLKKKELIFLQSIGPRLGGLLTKDIGELKRIFARPHLRPRRPHGRLLGIHRSLLFRRVPPRRRGSGNLQLSPVPGRTDV